MRTVYPLQAEGGLSGSDTKKCISTDIFTE
jgi:hypothetical protein